MSTKINLIDKQLKEKVQFNNFVGNIMYWCFHLSSLLTVPNYKIKVFFLHCSCLQLTYIKAYIKREKIGLNPMVRVTLFSMGK